MKCIFPEDNVCHEEQNLNERYSSIPNTLNYTCKVGGKSTH